MEGKTSTGVHVEEVHFHHLVLESWMVQSVLHAPCYNTFFTKLWNQQCGLSVASNL